MSSNGQILTRREAAITTIVFAIALAGVGVLMYDRFYELYRIAQENPTFVGSIFLMGIAGVSAIYGAVTLGRNPNNVTEETLHETAKVNSIYR